MDWAFDLRTAILLGALVTALTGGLLLISWQSMPAAVRPPLAWWLAGMAAHALGFGLLGLDAFVPAVVGIPLSHWLIAAAFSAMAMSLRHFYGLPDRRGWLAMATVSAGALALWFTHVQPDLQWRIISVALVMTALLAVCARSVFRRAGPPGPVPRLTAALFAFAAVAVVLRAGHELFWPIAADQMLEPSLLNLAGIGTLVLLPVMATVGFLLMCTERSQEELERTARMDYLTGIFNRRAIEDLAGRALSASRRHGIPLAIMLVDVDHFKMINDEHGHEVGDQALIETVRRMREIMRAEDLVGRQGGEEFVAVMPDIDLGSAHAAAERLRRNFAERPMRVHLGRHWIHLTVTVSIGVAALEPADRQFSHLLRRADRAMYAAKAAGRNRVMLDIDGM